MPSLFRSARDRHLAALSALIVAAGAGVILGRLFSNRLDPEMQWIRELHAIKNRALETADGPRVLVVGGSSALYAFDAGLIAARLDRPVINLGLHAGLGATFMVGNLDRYVRPGDLVVLSIEPDLLDGPVRQSALGRRAAMAFGDPELARGGDVDLAWFPRTDRLAVRLAPAAPGLSRIVTWLGNTLSGAPQFRYSAAGVDRWGYDTTRVHVAHPVTPERSTLSGAWANALGTAAESLETRGAHVVFALPWREVPDGDVEESRRYAARFLREVNAIMPVVADPGCGIVATGRGLFADTQNHLTRQGATLRSRRLAEALANGWIVPKGERVTDDCEPAGGVPPPGDD